MACSKGMSVYNSLSSGQFTRRLFLVQNLQQHVMGTVLSLQRLRFKEGEKGKGNTYNGKNSVNKGSGLFLNLGMTDIFGWLFLCCGGCPASCRVFSSIPGL